MKLLIATHNKGKVQELQALLAGTGWHCLTLAEAGVEEDVEETGTTFVENATLKAVNYARMTGLLTLADDSGLCVEALEGRPGVYTARFGGRGLSQAERNQFLLDHLLGVPAVERSAEFCCVMALANPVGEIVATTEGVCRGRIAEQPAGTGGFGYDPIFFLPDRGCTTAQLSAEEKHAISHRGQAVRAMLLILTQYAQNAP